MTLMAWTRATLLGSLMILSAASTAQASSARTFVASTGNDANTSANCAATSPCRSFAAAYGVTSSGGEIIALDAAGFGTLTITGPVSIIGVLNAAITVPASTAGVTVNAGAANVVILRNLQINGGNAASSAGVVVNSGRLVLEDATLKLLATGLSVNNSKADVVNTDIIGNTVGVATTGTGVNVQSASGTNAGLTEVRFAGGHIVANTTAFTMASPGLNGSSQNNVTIWMEQIASNPSTTVVGNATVTTITGTGSSCGTCFATGGFSFQSLSNTNFQ